MPIGTKADLKAAARALSLTQITTAANEVMQTLSPLLSVDSSLDEKLVQVLKGLMEHFVQAVQHMYTTTKYTFRALSSLCSMLAAPASKLHPPAMMIQLQNIAENFLCGHSSATDGRNRYMSLGKEVEAQFKLVADNYGSRSILKMTGKGDTKQISLNNLHRTIVKHLGDSETSSSATVDVLAGINTLLQQFLEDQDFSLAKPLTTVPFLSPDMFKTWNFLRDSFNRLQVDLRAPMAQYPSWFQWTFADEESALEADRKIRKEKIALYQIRIQVPAKPPSSPSMSTVARAFVRSGECLINVHSINPTQPGITEVKVVVAIPMPGSWFHLKSFYILCDLQPLAKSSSVRFSKNKSATLKDITGDPEFEPKDCKPVFEVDTSSASVIKWIFSRPFPFSRWKSLSPFPTQVALTFDLEHQVSVAVELEAIFIYRQKFPFQFLTTSEQLGGELVINPSTEPVASPGPVESSTIITNTGASAMDVQPGADVHPATDVQRAAASS